ncbi:hypothetical protein [Gymnodinialimonas ceratoperidinii]|uniref:DUF4386 family protein n=1 Tax=Gymnodinialimonas ceratoperidinii TaxID=2856823 RepID=A0A8F6YDM7_9RHOB|nr:hypothetical protein [Gymnodinialimonas ceratoperidinii]QXT40645.1 hypothetical protein KYE46_05250 [Gymnodinialimonas ceratoperidinii]
MTLRTFGGLAALLCGGTYVFGFALLLTVLAPLGFGSGELDADAVVAFASENPGLLITWNTGIYIINALGLTVLVTALAAHLRPATPDGAALTRAFGLIWATLVLAAGMVANVAVERAVTLAAHDPEGAAQTWEVLHAVELGLGGGNEIAGAVWIACVSLFGWRGKGLGRFTSLLGLVTGAAGIITLVPAAGDVAGAVFGLGAIGWFFAIGVDLLRVRARPGPAAAGV